MKINKKDSKKIIIALIVIILIIGLVLFFNKSRNDTSIKNKSAINTEELNKNAVKTSKGNSTTAVVKSGENGTSVVSKDTVNQEKAKAAQQQKAKVAQQQKTQTAQQEKAENAKAINSKEGFTVFVKAANFGSTAELIIDNSKSSSYKYYQFSQGNKAISKIESITKNKTTIFPAQEVGTEVVIKFLGQDKKVIKELKTKLSVR